MSRGEPLVFADEYVEETFRLKEGEGYVLRPFVVDDGFIASYGVSGRDESMGLFEQCSKDICFFTKHLLQLDITSFQAFVLRRLQLAVEGRVDFREVGLLAARQVGKTDGVIVPFNLWMALFNKSPIENSSTRCLIFSASKEQGEDLIDRCKTRLEAADGRLSRIDQDKFGDNFFGALLDAGDVSNATMMRFPSSDQKYGDWLFGDSLVGSSIETSTPSQTSLGDTGSCVTIDETAIVTDEFYWDVAFPFTQSVDGVSLLTSTPQRNKNFFYDYCEQSCSGEDDGFYCFDIDGIRVERPVYHENVLKRVEKQQSMGRGGSVDRNYLCKWTDEAGTFFKQGNIQRMFSPDLDMVDPGDFDGVVDVGVDFGGTTSSHTVITVSHLGEDGCIRRVWHKRYEINKTDSLFEDLLWVRSSFDVQRWIPDDCPQGWDTIKRMEKEGFNLHPMNFSRDKLKKFESFKRFLRTGRVKSYEDDVLHGELKNLVAKELRRTTRLEPIGGATDDLVDSFVMSCYFFLNDDVGGTEVISFEF